MGPGYSLVCKRCGWEDGEHRYTVYCPSCERRAFLQTRYDHPLEISGPEDDFASYRSWLPFDFCLPLGPMRIGCVKAEALGRSIGLEELWILLSCWAPDHGATLPACTFKTLEAAAVMMRVREQTDRTLIMSSAGNAGAAVIELGARHGVPAIVVMPESALPIMQSTGSPDGKGPLLICIEHSTYGDAIELVGRILDRFEGDLVREGGAYNVARRDAMGVPVLRAVMEMGGVPDHYVQAVGSGTGGIAAHEAVGRLAESGRHRGGAMRLHLVQNDPFTPMVDAWTSRARQVAPMSLEEAYRRLEHTYSNVLANANPPYGVEGGVRDVLEASGGDMLSVTNDEARAARDAFSGFYDIVPYPEACVALAGLVKQVEAGRIPRNEAVLVHVTGGGHDRSVRDLGKIPYPAGATIRRDDLDAALGAVDRYLGQAGDRPR